MGFAFFRCADGRCGDAAEHVPGPARCARRSCSASRSTKAAVAEAIARWKADELEDAAAEAGVVMPRVRTLPEMMAERQYTDVLADLPLVEVTKIGDSDPEPLPPLGEQPFSGLRALGMGHVIAGAGFGRSFALHGADVLNLWRPGETEHETMLRVGERRHALGVPRPAPRPRRAHPAARRRRRPLPQPATGVPRRDRARAGAGGGRAAGARVGDGVAARPRGALGGPARLRSDRGLGDRDDDARGRRGRAAPAPDPRRQRLHRPVAGAGRGRVRAAPAGGRGRLVPRARVADPGRAVDPLARAVRPRVGARDGRHAARSTATSTPRPSPPTPGSARTRASPTRWRCRRRPGATTRCSWRAARRRAPGARGARGRTRCWSTPQAHVRAARPAARSAPARVRGRVRRRAPPAPVPSALPTARAAVPPSTAPASPAPVVVLDPGHNGGNAGAADEIAREVPDGRGGTKPCNTTGTDTAGGYAEHAFAFDVAQRVTRVLTEPRGGRALHPPRRRRRRPLRRSAGGDREPRPRRRHRRADRSHPRRLRARRR